MIPQKDVEQTGSLVRNIARLHTQLQRECVACCGGTTATQCTMVTELGRHGPMTLADLSRRIGFDKSWTSRAVDVLVAEGLVEKTPGATDRRTVLLSLSPAGEQRHQELNTALNRLAAQVLHHIPAEQREMVEQALVLLEQAHLATLEDGSACEIGCELPGASCTCEEGSCSCG